MSGTPPLYPSSTSGSSSSRQQQSSSPTGTSTTASTSTSTTATSKTSNTPPRPVPISTTTATSSSSTVLAGSSTSLGASAGAGTSTTTTTTTTASAGGVGPARPLQSQTSNLSISSSPKESSPHELYLQDKAEEINLILLQPDVDLWKLRELALGEGGLVNDTIRKRAWPKLVGLHKYYNSRQYSTFGTSSSSAIATISGKTSRSSNTSTTGMSSSAATLVTSAPASAAAPTAASSASSTALPPLPGDGSSAEQPKFEIDTTAIRKEEEPEGVADLLVQSMDVTQIERDVARCTWHLLSGTQRYRRVQYKNKDRKKVHNLLRRKQRRLANLINLTLVESYELSPTVEDRLRYYQGYHDVACIFLHALGGGNTNPLSSGEVDPMGLDLPAQVLCQISFSHLRDHLRSSFDNLQTALRVALFPLIRKLDVEVHEHLLYSDMEPFFCLSWVLTWFSHDVRDTEVVKRLFDAFICSHPLFPLYVSVAMLLHPFNRELILTTDCDFAALHQCLTMLPRNSCRVGWKKRFDGEGYVSDDEGPHEADSEIDSHVDSVSTDVDSQWDHDTHGGMSVTEERKASSASMGNSSRPSSGGGSLSVGPIEIEVSHDHVPFQVLIDTALKYMRKYPPRCLVAIAQNYYQKNWHITKDNVSTISLLQNPPTWSLAGTAKSDWVLKQRVRQEMGLKSTSRKDRRKKKKILSLSSAKITPEEAAPLLLSKSATVDNEATPLVDETFLKQNPKNRAVIAAGFGQGPEEEKRRRRKKMLKVAATVTVVIVALGFAYRHYPPTLWPSSSRPTLEVSSADNETAGGGGGGGSVASLDVSSDYDSASVLRTGSTRGGAAESSARRLASSSSLSSSLTEASGSMVSDDVVASSTGSGPAIAIHKSSSSISSSHSVALKHQGKAVATSTSSITKTSDTMEMVKFQLLESPVVVFNEFRKQFPANLFRFLSRVGKDLADKVFNRSMTGSIDGESNIISGAIGGGTSGETQTITSNKALSRTGQRLADSAAASTTTTTLSSTAGSDAVVAKGEDGRNVASLFIGGWRNRWDVSKSSVNELVHTPALN